MTDKQTIDMYLKQGINIVPIAKGDGKALKMSGWDRYCNEKYIETIPTDQDFAVMMGKASDNLVCLDFDHCDSLEVLNDVIPDCLNKSLVVRSGNGYHIYLRTTDIATKDDGKPIATIYLHKEINGVKYNLELKAHGSYVIGASSDHYDKDDQGKYHKTDKTYRVISNTTDVHKLESTHLQLFSKLKDKEWLTASEVKIGADGTFVEKESVMEITMRKWGSGERYNNGWRVALTRFMADWDYDKVLEEAKELNQRCCDPPHSNAEVARWVNNAIPIAAKNKTDKDSQYFKKNTVSKNSKGEKEDEIGEVADALLEKYHFKTYKDTDELLVWDGKVYNAQLAESIVRETCETDIEECTAHQCAEVIAKIKRRSYVMRELFNYYPCEECEGEGTDKDDNMCELCKGKGKFNIITLENGILNIDTMNFMEHNHRNLSTFHIPVTWDDTPLAHTDTGFATLEKLLGDTKFWKYITECFTINKIFDSESQKNVYTALESMAFILLKNNAITKSVMYIGGGSNGKSLLLEYIDSMFGKKNVTHIPIQEISEGGFVLSRLDGKLANIFADIESTEMRKSGKLKQIIGGEGIEVQRKYQDPYTMYSRAKFIFSANRFPKTYDQTDGFFRRFIVLQWNRKFHDDEKDMHLLERLVADKKEMAQVFKVLVKLAKEIDSKGDFTFTKPINEVRETWNELADPILMFIQKKLTDAGGNICTKKEVYEAYIRFAQQHEMVPLRIGAFGTEFRNYYEEVTVRDKDTSSVSKYWCDFKIKPDPRQDGAMDKHLG